MNARQIIDRLAALDEASPAPDIAEPEVDPGIAPPQREPDRDPGVDPNDPWGVPPDFDPETFPPGKAEDDEGAIESWLQTTQQPVRDWQWDGQVLKLLLNDGTVESYSREQLDAAGVFGEMSFAESVQEAEDEEKEDEGEEKEEEESAEGEDDKPEEGHEEPDGDEAPPFGGENEDGPELLGGGDDVQGILGNEGGEAIEVQGPPAEQLAQALGDVVQAILGIVQQQQTGGLEGGEGAEGMPPGLEGGFEAGQEAGAEEDAFGAGLEAGGEAFGAGLETGEELEAEHEGEEEPFPMGEAKLSYGARKRLPKGDFVFPEKRKFPIEDKAHARNALSRAGHKGGSTESKVRAAVHRKYPDIGEK